MSNIATLFIYIELEGEGLSEETENQWIEGDCFFAPKDAKYFEFENEKKIERRREKNYFSLRFEQEQKSNESINEILLNFVKGKEEKIVKISNISKVEKRIHISIYPETVCDVIQYNFDISNELMERLLMLDIELSFSFFMSKPFGTSHL